MSNPKVYMTKDISPAGLKAAYEALNRQAEGKVAVKLSMGEPGGHNFLQPALIKELVQSVNGVIVDANTAYGGKRDTAESHMETAKNHGFLDIAQVDILDADGDVALSVEGGKHLKENYVGRHYLDYDFTMVLSHFKGHAMGGFGGAVKNISIGIASSAGKGWIHSAGTKTSGDIFSAPQDDFLESMAEAAGSIMAHAGNNILYINVMNRLSVDCDCDSNPAEPDMQDIGILSSLDPVALDKACVDLVYAADDGASLIERMETRNGIRTLEHAAEMGLGSLEYKLVSLDR